MKGKRTKNGELMIMRGDQFLMQQCVKQRMRFCADDCPMFGEPSPCVMSVANMDGSKETLKRVGPIEIEICENRTLVFDEFEDER